MTDKITVIVPVYNRCNLVGRCLDSILGQTLRPVTLIIVDNGSDDGTPEVVSKWIKHNTSENFSATLLHENKRGACAARNRGLAEVKTPLVCFFDSDDVMLPDLLEKAVAEFEKDPELELLFWRSEVIKANGKAKPKRFSTKNIWKRHLYNGLLATQNFMITTELARRAGGWDETLPAWNDWEFGVRLLLNANHIKGIPYILARIYPQKISITGEKFSENIGKWELSLNAVEKDITAVENISEKKRKRLLDMVFYRKIILAALYHKEGDRKAAVELRKKTMKHCGYPPHERRLLDLIYYYTTLGGRAAYLLWK